MADPEHGHRPTDEKKTSFDGASMNHTVINDESGFHQGQLSRHLPPIPPSSRAAVDSIGGVIGTGLLLGYMAVGSICWTVMVRIYPEFQAYERVVSNSLPQISLGEMVAFLPISGGHIKLAERYNWAIILPAELSAASVLIGFWDKETNPSAWIAICLVVVIVINMLGAGAYGEAEFIFASIKVVTIVGLIILGIVLDLGGGPNGGRLGFHNWKHPGPFNQFQNIGGVKGRFLGWWAVMTQAAFSFIGTEIVAIAAGEAKNPRRNLPKVIKRVYIRILLFYILGTFIIGLLVPSNAEGLNLADGIDRSTLPFASKFQPYAAYYAAGFSLIICFFSGWAVFLKGNWATDTFVTNYLPLVVFPIMYRIAKQYYRQPIVKPSEMDFVSDLAEIEAITYDEPPPKNKIEAFWQWLM
ncbi:hypothetical protein BDN72DRAFT_852187 [Pluteus cervinus]|uniref:Uncharacterized protein n=1 Tax=Pluteus cervinus TaxID=181527 RepID=A0ACD3BH23_9AGAR|nr:hypothetical protein BDN72DRAFT_852187 [Pluteus cervinus]